MEEPFCPSHRDTNSGRWLRLANRPRVLLPDQHKRGAPLPPSAVCAQEGCISGFSQQISLPFWRRSAIDFGVANDQMQSGGLMDERWRTAFIALTAGGGCAASGHPRMSTHSTLIGPSPAGGCGRIYSAIVDPKGGEVGPINPD